MITRVRSYFESCHTISAIYLGVLKGNKLQKGCAKDVRSMFGGNGKSTVIKKEKEIQCGVPQ